MTLYCPQCGEDTSDFYEGYCLDCCNQNQSELDAHYLAYDEWGRLTDEQKDARIRDAVRKALRS